ncbi:MAG TPA: glycosyltransferase family 25 protein [Cellvibrionaceae bacterium]
MSHPPVYVINLPQSTDRRASIDRQAEELGFTPTYFQAIDGYQAGHSLFGNVNQARRLRFKGRPFKPGELGVWASHYLLWQACVQENRVIIVLEDDAKLMPNFVDFLQHAEDLAESFPYLRLYNSPQPSKKLQTIAGFSVHRYWRSPLRATGYLLAPEAAGKFLQQAEQWVLPVDDYMDLAWLHGVDCLGIKPGCVHDYTEFATTIQIKAPKERLTVGQKLAREVFRGYLRFRHCLDFFWRSSLSLILRVLSKK